MSAIYFGSKARMLAVLAFIKLCRGTQSYCSFKEYATTLKPDRYYKLVDDGCVIHINRVG